MAVLATSWNGKRCEGLGAPLRLKGREHGASTMRFNALGYARRAISKYGDQEQSRLSAATGRRNPSFLPAHSAFAQEAWL